jgi:hypothetical protein
LVSKCNERSHPKPKKELELAPKAPFEIKHGTTMVGRNFVLSSVSSRLLIK